MKVTQEYIAGKAGISQAAVSLALRGDPSIPDGTRDKVFSICRELGYRTSGRSAVPPGATGSIGYLIPRGKGASAFLTDPYYHRFLEGVEEGAAEEDYDFFMVALERDGEIPRVIERDKVDGLIVEEKVDAEWVERVKDRMPLVLLNWNLDDCEVDSVMPDSRAGAVKAVRHLHALGHRRIAFFSLKPHSIHGVEIERGFREACGDLRINISGKHIITPEAVRLDLREVKESAVEALRTFMALPEPPTAIVSTGDVYALPLLEAAREMNISVPEDLSLIGFDDMVEGRHSVPALTTFREPLEEMARMACRLLFDRVRRPETPARKVLMAAEMIERGSTAASK